MSRHRGRRGRPVRTTLVAAAGGVLLGVPLGVIVAPAASGSTPTVYAVVSCPGVTTPGLTCDGGK